MVIKDSANIRVAIIILTVNQKDKTLNCLDSLNAVLPACARILVWDNGSTDGTAAAVNERFPQVVVESHPRNLGVASGRNRGAQSAIKRFQPTHLLFLDNDMILTEGFVEGLLKPFLTEARVGQTQAKLRFMHEPERLNDGGGCRIQYWLGKTMPVGYREIDRGQHDTLKPCVACGGAMMVQADLFAELDGFDSQFDPFGPEDLDFSLRLQKAGYQALYAPEALAYHEVSHTTGTEGYSETYAQNRSRHWLAFMSRHASMRQKLSFFCIGAPLIALKVLLREGKKGNWGAITGLFKGVLRATNRNAKDTR